MALKLSNNAISRLASGITAASTSISLVPGDGALFPTLGAGDYFPATIIKSDGSLEIVKVTARSTDTLTVTRAQEGTTAKSFNASDRIELRLTAAIIEAFDSGKVSKSGDTMTGDLTMGVGTKIVMEGSTDDANEVTIDPGNPTADRTLTLPNKSGTLATTSDVFGTSNIGDLAVTPTKLSSGGPSWAADGSSFATGGTIPCRISNNATSIFVGDNFIGAGTGYGINSSSAYLYMQTYGTERVKIFQDGKAQIGTGYGSGSRLTVNDHFAVTNGGGAQCILIGNQDTGGLNRPAIIQSANSSLQFGYGTSWSAGSGGTFTKVVEVAGDNFYFNSGFGSSALVFGCRAWVNLNGSTNGVRGSGNVSSIGDLGAAYYRVNFASVMPDVNYAAVGCASGPSASNLRTVNPCGYATGSVDFGVTYADGAMQEVQFVNLAVIR